MNKRKIMQLSFVILTIIAIIIPNFSNLVRAETEETIISMGRYIPGGYSAVTVDVLTGTTRILTDASGNKYVDLREGSTLAINIGSVTAFSEGSTGRAIYRVRILVYVYDYTYKRMLSTSYILSDSAPVFEKQNNEAYGTYYSVLMDAAELLVGAINPIAGLGFTFLGYLYNPGGMTLGTSGSCKTATWTSGTWDTHLSQECKWFGSLRGLSYSDSRIYGVGIGIEITQYYNFAFWTNTLCNVFYINGIPTSDGSGAGGGSGPVDTID